jgi:zinc transport system permease protein
MNDDKAPTLGQFFDAWDLFGTAATAGAVAGVLLGTLGVYIVLRRMVFLSAVLSQAAGLGVALSFYAQLRVQALASLALSPAWGALASTILAALPFFSTSSGPRGARRDGMLGLAYLIGAAGTLVVGSRIVDAEDIQSILFGSAVVVLPESFQGLCILAVVVLGVHLWWRRGFIQASLDPDGATVRGLPVRALNLALLLTIATSISVATRVLGALPVFAFSVLPALGALRITQTVPRALVVAGVLGAIAGFVGYLVAFLGSFPVGASQALMAAVLVGVCEAVKRVLLWTGRAR